MYLECEVRSDSEGCYVDFQLPLGDAVVLKVPLY